MLLKELISLAIGKLSAGPETDETMIRRDRVKVLLLLARTVIIPDIFKKNSRVHDSWVQPFYPVYDARRQEDANFTVFDSPQKIMLDNLKTSIRFVGSLDCMEAYRLVWSSGEMANLFSNHFMSPANGRNIFALYENQMWKIYNRNHIRIEKFRENSIVFNPFDVPTWNPDLDNFPLDGRGCQLAIDFVFKNYFVDTLKIPANLISNSQEDSRLPQTPAK